MAADKKTPKEDSGKSLEEQVNGLLGYLQTPIKQMQDWVSSGQLQSTIEKLQERAERAQEGVERHLRALNEVRQGVQTHVKKQLEGSQKPQAERPDAATVGPSSPPVDPPAPKSSGQTAPPKVKGSGPRKKSRGKKSSGRKP